MLRELDERLVTHGGGSIETFLIRCEGAITEFEASMLNTAGFWNGMPIYGLRQMFRILWRIRSAPYGFAASLDKKENAPKISFYSLDPAERFQDVWYDLRPPILASATLSPVSDVAYLLGLGHGIRAKINPVFPVKNYLSFAFLGCHSAASQNVDAPVLSKAEEAMLENTIGPILAKTHVHTGLYCASHRVLDHVVGIITKEYVSRYGMRLLIARSDRKPVNDDFEQLRSQVDQKALKGLGDFDARLQIYQELAGKIPAVLCGVTGGGFGEGVDFRGELMELAIIIGIPYEGAGDMDWLNNLRTSLFKMRRGDDEIGKDLAYRQSALRKVAQTAGRVHRTQDDRGAVIFFDERLLGVKNTGRLGAVTYEYLSPENSRRHWDIIQTRIRESLRVVIPPAMNDGDNHDAQAHIQRVFRNVPTPPEIIDFPAMLDMLSEFYI
jgi:Rad3-related DNA helicase